MRALDAIHPTAVQEAAGRTASGLAAAALEVPLDAHHDLRIKHTNKQGERWGAAGNVRGTSCRPCGASPALARLLRGACRRMHSTSRPPLGTPCTRLGVLWFPQRDGHPQSESRLAVAAVERLGRVLGCSGAQAPGRHAMSLRARTRTVLPLSVWGSTTLVENAEGRRSCSSSALLAAASTALRCRAAHLRPAARRPSARMSSSS